LESANGMNELTKVKDELFGDVGHVFNFDVRTADDESLVKYKKRVWLLLESLGGT
jgi:hypothetical protein